MRRIEKNRKGWLRFAATVLLCGAPLAACAQVNTASLSGFVTDASGAADAGARVTATNEETGYVRSLATDATGFYWSLPVVAETSRVRVVNCGD